MQFKRTIERVKQTRTSVFLMCLNLSHFDFLARKWQKNAQYPNFDTK